jgi:L-seryl-tRNA(Ser) seleniumtransferase
VLLRVHTSNFRVLGFTAEVSLEELVELGKKHNIPVIDDLGSGALIDFSKYGLNKEPTVQEVVNAGVDVVTFSGDKLLGGPQAGIIVGKKDIIEKMKKNPLTRAMRVDKFTLAGLEMTLRQYLNEESAIQKIPTLRMLLMPISEIEDKAIKLKSLIDKAIFNFQFSIFISLIKGSSQVGGGALPLEELPTVLVAITSGKISSSEIEKHLRDNEPPIITRIQQEQVLLDPRTIQDGEYEVIVKALKNIITKLL